MGTSVEKLEYLKETKELIRQAIVNKGQSVSTSLPFRQYKDKINAITTASPVKSPISESVSATIYMNSGRQQVVITTSQSISKLCGLYLVFGNTNTGMSLVSYDPVSQKGIAIDSFAYNNQWTVITSNGSISISGKTITIQLGSSNALTYPAFTSGSACYVPS